jgi:hypothetical protein
MNVTARVSFVALLMAGCATQPPLRPAPPPPAPAIHPAPAAAVAPAPNSEASIDTIARDLVTHFVASDFAGTSAHFDATMKSALTAERMQQVRSAITAQLGAFTQIRGSRNTVESGYRIVFVRTGFANGDVEAKVAFNDQGEVAGLYFVPAAQ